MNFGDKEWPNGSRLVECYISRHTIKIRMQLFHSIKVILLVHIEACHYAMGLASSMRTSAIGTSYIKTDSISTFYSKGIDLICTTKSINIDAMVQGVKIVFG